VARRREERPELPGIGVAVVRGSRCCSIGWRLAILERSGQLFSSWELGREYRFTDTDGRRPDWGASKIDFSKHPEQLLQLLRDWFGDPASVVERTAAKDETLSHPATTDRDQGCLRYADGIGPGSPDEIHDLVPPVVRSPGPVRGPQAFFSARRTPPFIPPGPHPRSGSSSPDRRSAPARQNGWAAL
jgi:hypothetical protein